jgi:hypothetical protein
VAVTVTDCALLTLPAIAENVAIVVPAATVTEAGTVKSSVLLDNATLAPPEGAGDESVTVHVELAPIPRLVAAHPIELKTAGGVSERIIC